MIEFRTRQPSTHTRTPIDLSGPTRAQQQFKEEVDINNIMKKYQKIGAAALGPQREPQYLDVSDGLDLQGAITRAQQAEEAFMDLPSSIRREFDNSPIRMYEFLQDPANIERAQELGLLPSEPSEAPAAPPEPEPTPPPGE